MYTPEGAEVDKAKLLNTLRIGQVRSGGHQVWIDESAEMIEWFAPMMEAAGKQTVLIRRPRILGGTDYMPYLQHVPAAYTPPMRNDVLAEHIEGLGHEIR